LEEVEPKTVGPFESEITRHRPTELSDDDLNFHQRFDIQSGTAGRNTKAERSKTWSIRDFKSAGSRGIVTVRVG